MEKIEITSFDKGTFPKICRQLAKADPHLGKIIEQFGLPPMWSRPRTFSSLILTILEQQVSLASAYAAFKKLKQKIRYVTPERVLALTDEELRACYFSRQKIVYARGLANAILTKQLPLNTFHRHPDEHIRVQMKQLKGIGDWTVDVYLMHALQRSDLFPLGDIALVNSLREVMQLPKDISKEEMLLIAEKWRPHRTIAAMILWHAYIQKRGIKIQG
jgi:DNA-3-methyladenine glycosylase II